MPGINQHIADTLLIRQDSYDMGGYLKLHGDPSRVIGHWLGEDDIVEPLWNTGTLTKRLLKVRAWGVRTIAVSDFSTWLEMPLIVQLHNVYRTAVVTLDIARAGFKILPAIKLLCLPEYWSLYNGWVPRECPVALIDLHHVGNTDVNWRLLRETSRLYQRDYPRTYPWIWSFTPQYANWWGDNVGPCLWVPTRSYMMNKVIRARHKLFGQGKKRPRPKTATKGASA